VTPEYRAPVPLGDGHELDSFECRSAEQTSWLRRYARQSAATGTTKVFVVTEAGDPRVVAYYAWCMAQLTTEAAPPRARKGAGRYPQPVALLARLGIDLHHEGRGLGAALLQDVFARLLVLSDRIGCRGLLVHAESAHARDFYLHLVPEFEPSPTNELHLVLLMKDIRRAIGTGRRTTASGTVGATVTTA
jgi:GNAT superfamily N-acetyltransferase